MKNKGITKELGVNLRANYKEIFNNQKSEDLIELKETIKRLYPDDIVVDFDLPEYLQATTIFHNMSKRSEEKMRQSVEHYVSLKVLQEIDNKLTLGFFDQIERDLAIFSNGDTKDYIDREECLPTFAEIIPFFKNTSPASNRLHFILNGNKSDRLCGALLPYLDEKFPCTTMVYLSPDSFSVPYSLQNETTASLLDNCRIFEGIDSQKGKILIKN